MRIKGRANGFNIEKMFWSEMVRLIIKTILVWTNIGQLLRSHDCKGILPGQCIGIIEVRFCTQAILSLQFFPTWSVSFMHSLRLGVPPVLKIRRIYQNLISVYFPAPFLIAVFSPKKIVPNSSAYLADLPITTEHARHLAPECLSTSNPTAY